MNTLFPRIAALGLFVASGGALFASDAPPAAAAAHTPTSDNKHGYTVTFEVHVNDKGEEETIKMLSSEDTTPDRFIEKLALAMAIKTDLPPREKDGKAIAYTARLPFFFPIEGDDGPEANNAPKPVVSRESGVPVYPADMRDAGIVGGAIFEMQIDATGKLTKLTTLRASHQEFEHAARQTLENWKFKPAQKDGQPVACRWNIAVVFEMGDKAVDLKWRIPPRPSLGSLKILGDLEEKAKAAKAAAAAAAAVENPAAAPAEPAK
jgi:TonB family protein